MPGPALDRASTSSTSRTTRSTRSSSRSSRPRSFATAPATAARTRSIAAPTGSTSPRSATPRRRPGGVFLLDHDDFEPARALGDRSRPAAAGLRRVVEHRLRHAADQRVGHAEHGRGRHRARAAARQPVRPPPARLGPAPAPPQAGDRPRRRAPDGARAAPRPRPDASPTASSASSSRPPTCQRVGLAVAPPGRRQRGGREGHHDPAPSRPSPTSCRRALQALQRRAAAGHRHRPVARRPARSTSRAGAPASSSATTSPTRAARETRLVRIGGIVARAPHPASGAGQRRPADGRGQPRRQARLPDQLAVRLVGRAVLPRGHRRLDGQARHRRRRSTLDPNFFVEFDGERPHQVRLEGGDASSATPTASRRDRRRGLADPRRARRLPRRSTPPWAGCSPSRAGMQERSRRAVLRSLRADRASATRLSIALVAAARRSGCSTTTDPSELRIGAAAVLVGLRHLPLRQAARALPLDVDARRPTASWRCGRS